MSQSNNRTKSLYVGNLDPTVTNKMLKREFSDVSEVLSAHIQYHPGTKKSRGFAYINFKDADDAEQALQVMNGYIMKGKQMDVQWNLCDSSFKESQNANIIVKNLNKSVTDEDLEEMFEAFGKILSAKVVCKKNASKVFGYVNFESEKDAIKAIKTMNDTTICGEKVYVEKFIPQSERTKHSMSTSAAVSPRCSAYATKQHTPSGLKLSPSSDYWFVEKSPTIHDRKQCYLNSMLCGTYKPYCNKKINRIFDENDARGRLAAVGNKAILVTTTEEAHIKCCQLLEKMIYFMQVKMPEGTPFSKITDKSLKKVLKEKKKSEKNLKYIGILIEQENVFVVSFIEEGVKEAAKIIESFAKSFLFTKLFHCQKQEAEFLTKHFDCDQINLNKAENGVEISGETTVVLQALKQLRNKKFQTGEVMFSAAGLSTYFTGNTWSKTIETFESKARCSVHIEQKSTPFETFSNPARVNSLRVEVCHGNIINETSDVIINGVSKEFKLNWGTVSTAILKKAGQEMQKECTSSPLLAKNSIRATKGWNLPCKFVLHMVTPDSKEKLVSRLKRAFSCAKELHADSVSVPTLGAGGIGLEPLDVALAMREAIAHLQDEQNNETRCFIESYNILHIRIVVFEPELVPLFEQHAVPDTEYSCFQAPSVRQNNDEEWAVEVTCDERTSISEATSYLKSIRSSILCEIEIPGRNISKLEEHDKLEIDEYAAKLEASWKFDKSGSNIIVSGLKDNAEQLKKHIERILTELANALVIAKVCEWKWELTRGKYSRLPLRVSQYLVTQFEKSPSAKMKVRIDKEDVVFDFSTQTFNMGSKRGKLVREERSKDETISLPPEWGPMNGQSKGRYVVPPGTREYQKVVDKFQPNSSLYGRTWTIVKIERLQNEALYRQYQIKKQDVAKHVVKNEPVERDLFHGTTREDADRIWTDCFDRGFAGKNATAYGKGTYFAVNSSYSENYARSDASGLKCMFLASVLTGNYCKGDPSYKAPPPMGFKTPIRLYDSVVDHVSSPSIFVVFKDTSVYPKYLITFK